MNPFTESLNLMTRRQLFAKGALGLGSVALSSLLPGMMQAGDKQSKGGIPGLPHFAPKAKRAIYLFMNEGPSQMDMWDYKPKMNDFFDKDLPESIRKGQRLTTMTSGQTRFPIAPSKYKFSQHGKNGTWASELIPHTAEIS